MYAAHGFVGAGLLLVYGCVEGVPLGTECPEYTSRCRVVSPVSSGLPDASRAPRGRLDASTVAPDLLDAALAPTVPGDIASDGGEPSASVLDAGADASAGALFPELRNGSFEPTQGRFGPLALPVLSATPIAPLVGSAQVEPWVACRMGFAVESGAESDRRTGASDVSPSDGRAFIEASASMNMQRGGLRQTLARPLRQGARYAFRIDLRASSHAEIALEVWGSFYDCLPMAKLAEVTTSKGDGWHSRCAPFTAPANLTQIVLVPTLRGGEAADSPRLFFDNVRADPECDPTVRARTAGHRRSD